MWNVTEDSMDIATNMLAYARSQLESEIGKLPGVHFVVGCFTGLTNNDKGKQKGGCSSRGEAKPGLSFIVCYSPSHNMDETTIVDIVNMMGFAQEVEVKEVATRVKETDEVLKVTLAQCAGALKDENNEYAKKIFQQSTDFCRERHPDMELSKHLVSITVCNSHVWQKCLSFQSELRKVKVDTGVSKKLVQMKHHYRTERPKGLDLSLEIMMDYMNKNNFRIHKGIVFQRNFQSVYTFERGRSVEAFVHMSQSNPYVASKVSVSHIAGLVKILGHADFSRMEQLQFDEDLIEVLGGKSFDLAQMKFIDTPITPDQYGKKSPRAFSPWDPTKSPDPTKFIEMVVNSFPSIVEQAPFLVKWYQLLFYHRHQMKSKILLVWGPKV